MKIATVIGARPQFIKAAVVSHRLRQSHTEILIHTGQHYDYNMSEQFFVELNIPKPDYNLGISGGSHGQMTGKMLMSIEEVLMKEKPDLLLVYGDTNSTLAGALAAAKLQIPVCHVEAGVRMHTMSNPEEINRVLVDRISSLLLTSTEASLQNLRAEGVSGRAFFVGDPMYDAFFIYQDRIRRSQMCLRSLEEGEECAAPEHFYYMTCHREENTDDEKLTEIMAAMHSLPFHTVYPVHPRNKERASRIRREKGFDKILLVEPVGYLKSLALLTSCIAVVTDSGGLQREAFFARKPCVTILDFPCWQETMVGNRNQLSPPDASEILKRLQTNMTVDENYRPFGDGRSADRITECIGRLF